MPRTPEEWTEWAWQRGMRFAEGTPMTLSITEAIRRAQAQARRQAIEECIDCVEPYEHDAIDRMRSLIDQS